MKLCIHCFSVVLLALNSVLSQEDFQFTVNAPTTINPLQAKFLVVLTVEKGHIDIPVTFNVTVSKLQEFVVQPFQQVSLFRHQREILSFDISKEFRIKNNDYPKDLKILVSVYTEKYTTIVNRTLTLEVVDPVPELVSVKTNKHEYSPGENIEYRIVILKPIIWDSISDIYKIKVDFYDSNNVSLLSAPFNEIVMNRTRVHTDIIPASDKMRKLVVKVTHDGFTVETCVSLNLKNNTNQTELIEPVLKKQILSEVKLFVDKIGVNFSTPNITLTLSHLTTENEEAVQGYCEIYIGSDLREVESFKETQSTKRLGVDFESRGIKKLSGTLNLQQELNLTRDDISDTGKEIFIKSRCFHNGTSKWVDQHGPTLNVTIHPIIYNYNVKLLWAEKWGHTIKQKFGITRRDGNRLAGEILNVAIKLDKTGSSTMISTNQIKVLPDGTALLTWDTTPPYGFREDKDFVVKIGDFQKQFKLND